MDTITIIEMIKSEVKITKDQGGHTIEADRLLDYLEQLKDRLPAQIEAQKDLTRYAHERDMEQYKANININLANYSALMQQGRELTKAVIDIGQSAIKSAILINGASAVALLALIGNLWARNNDVAVAAINILMPSIGSFGKGTLLGAVSAGATYVCQYFYLLNYQEIINQTFQEEPDKPSIAEGKKEYRIGAFIFHSIAVIACIAAYYYFGIGIYSSNEAFLLQFK